MTITTIEEFNRWLEAPHEGNHLEFKEARNQYDSTKLFRYCVALANEGGGKLVLGVIDQCPRKVVGTRAFENLGDIEGRILDKVRFRVNAEQLQHPDGRIVIFHIPSRPTGTAYTFEGSYLMRSGEETVAMTEDRLRAIFAEGKPSWLMEMARDGLSPADVVLMIDSQSYFDLLKLPYPETREAVLERLVSERILCRTKNGLAVTNLGAVLFAKRLEDFNEISRKAPRVIVYDGTSKLRTKREQTRTYLKIVLAAS